jgi:hypothetical protein
MQGSTIHDWIKSITSIVQSVAVAAGIFFAVQQYKDNSRDISEKENTRRVAAANETIKVADDARVPMKKVIDFHTTLRSTDSDDAKNK